MNKRVASARRRWKNPSSSTFSIDEEGEGNPLPKSSGNITPNASPISHAASNPLTTRYSPCELVRWMAKAECGKLPCRRTHWPHLVFRTHSFLAFHIQLSFGTLGLCVAAKARLDFNRRLFLHQGNELARVACHMHEHQSQKNLGRSRMQRIPYEIARREQPEHG